MDAVTLLAESYIGTPSMCNVTFSAASSIGLDGQTIMREAIKKKFKERFDPKRCDIIFMDTESQIAPAWLDKIIHDEYWRETIYELMEVYPRSVFLNFAVLRIAESGFRQEISKLRTASTYIEIYNSILDNSFSNIIHVDDLEFEDRLPDIVRVCCEREETYLYAQILLQNLYEKEQSMPFIRLSKELEKAAIERGQFAFVDTLKMYLSNAPPEISSALKAIRSSQQATPGDIMILYKLYTSNNPPATSYIRDFELINTMVRSVFVPNNGVLRAELKDKLIYLIAYGTTRNDIKPLESQKPEIDRVCGVLKELQVSLNEKAKGENLKGAMKCILNSISLPIGSLAILIWIEYTSINTPYFETYFRSSEVPLLHLLLDEIASQHPLQRPFVFEVIKKCLRHPYQNFAPETLMTLQTAWIDRLLYLVQMHYTLPVLKFMKNVEREFDHSLIIHFVQHVLKMARAPYSQEFIEHMANILVPISEMLSLIKDVQKTVIDFFDEAKLDKNIIISEKLEKQINSLHISKSKRKQ
ncbi:unnamed protein product [Cunninghamella echinulata]